MSDLDERLGNKSLIDFLRRLPDNVIPTVDALVEQVDKCLVLTNSEYPRDSVVKKIAALVVRWLHQYGRDSTINLVGTFLIEQQTVTRRLGDGNDVSARSSRNTSELGDIPKPAELVGIGSSERPADAGKQRFVLIEGGGNEGSYAGDQAPEHITGGTHCLDREEGISRRLVDLELSEHQEDLRVFQKAYSVIRARVRTVEDEGRLMGLTTWSGTTASLGLLELVIHNIERVIGELRDMLTKIDKGVIPNLDKE